MNDKVSTNLGNIQKTLVLPLWGRVVETKKPKPLLIDKTAVQIIQKIDYDFAEIEKSLSVISQLGWIARSYHVDSMTRLFIQKHPTATIVNIGCGLDTTFDRIDNGRILWYDLDLPDVIALRKKLIPANERRILIEDSFLHRDWMAQVKNKEHVLLIAAGVLYYFEEQQLKKIFAHLLDVFPEGEILFDASSPTGINMANRMVIKASGMDEKSFLKWGIKDAKILESWDSRIKLLNQYAMFHNLKNNFSFKGKIMAWMSDMLKIQYMVHLKFFKTITASRRSARAEVT
ncbi:MAG: class I SAM-dependent methyltransferase [Deltaproteobacteria bacterium]|nr:class I SAM-dependent methyltransferase [Deltaproteobacteria bacterium]